MLLNITVTGDAALIARLDALPAVVAKALQAKIEVLTIKLQTYVIRNKLHGQVLHQRSGQLARSIQRRIEAASLAVYGFVYSAGDVKYAAIHEFGGVINHPGGTAYFPGAGINGGALFYSNKAAAAVAQLGHGVLRTEAHQIPIPERSFLRSSLRDQAPSIEKELRAVAIKTATQGLAA